MTENSRRRRTNAELDETVIREFEELVREHGFGNVTISALTSRAKIESNVFYRRYGSMADLYDILSKKYDFWINDTIDLSLLNTLGPRRFFAYTLKTLYKEFVGNVVMQKLLLWELAEDNSTTRRTAQMRDVMNQNLIKYYEIMFQSLKINIKAIIATLISGIYYLIMHGERAEFCSIDFNSPDGEKAFGEAVDAITNLLFDKLDQHNEKKAIIKRMIGDGVNRDKICEYLNISLAELKSYRLT